MKEKFAAKYNRVSEIIYDVARCTESKLILVGGTALALFYLKHRTSVDLDFVPVNGDEEKHKMAVKGCLTKKGYRTSVARYTNQFVIQFDDTAIKLEVFYPQHKIEKIETFDINGTPLFVASLDDLFKMKLEAYAGRKSVRDLFDIVFILKSKGGDYELVKVLISKYGLPQDEEEIKNYILAEKDYEFYKEVVKNASKASNHV